MTVRGSTVAIQGFGNAGAIAARLFAEKKAKIVAVSDSRGGVYNSRGIDPLKATRYKERSGTVVGMPGTSRVSNEDLLAMKCDILIPAALEAGVARPLSWKGSGDLFALSRADALAVQPLGTPMKEGDPIDVLILD